MVRHVAVPALLRVELLRAQRTIKGQLKVGSLMNGRSVRRQLFRLLEAQPTLDTLYRRVLDPPVAPQVRFVHHLLVTVWTLIARDLGVLQLVLVQRVGEAGAQRAMRALVLVPLVHRHVALQLELGGDASAALLARDRVLARVRAHVVLEQLGPIERTVAVGTLEDRVLALLAIDLILLHGHVLVRVPFPRLLELPLGPLVGVAWLADTLSGGGTLMGERERWLIGMEGVQEEWEGFAYRSIVQGTIATRFLLGRMVVCIVSPTGTIIVVIIVYRVIVAVHFRLKRDGLLIIGIIRITRPYAVGHIVRLFLVPNRRHFILTIAWIIFWVAE